MLRELCFWQGDEGHALLDFYDENGQEATIPYILDNTPDSDNEDDVRDLPELPALPGYRSFGEGSGYVVQYHWGMGHVALYAEV